MTIVEANPRVLIVTPEVTYLPNGMGNMANYLTAKAGGLADVSASLINALFDHGVDVHLALPDYRTMFNDHLPPFIKKQRQALRSRVPESRLHLAKDRVFYDMHEVYSGYENTNSDIALAFQREVINTIIPKVQPDLIHCNDWMTGLIPAMARGKGIPCLFTIHNIYSVKSTLTHIEDRGINTSGFFSHLFYENISNKDEDTRGENRVDFLVSGIFAAHFVNAVSLTFLKEIVEGQHDFVDPLLHRELKNKWNAGHARGILNGADPAFNPATDNHIDEQYSPGNHVTGKRKNKAALQKALGLIQDNHAPVFFWPSRLDTVQKGCRLFAEILHDVVSRYRDENLEIVFVANGEFRNHFENIVRLHRLANRVAICDFDEKTAALAYAASDFIVMPSRFEPCGLPQMIGPIYGSLPVAHDTGGIHDTITHIDVAANRGNGFLFEKYDSNGLFRAIGQAMNFYRLPIRVKTTQIKRIMQDSKSQFDHKITARKYIDLYERMLKRPLT